jgi:hypothetical protein
MALEHKPHGDLAAFLDEEYPSVSAIETNIDYSLLGDAAVKALRGKRLKDQEGVNKEKELLRQNIYDKTQLILESFGVSEVQEMPFQVQRGSTFVVRQITSKSSPVVPIPGWGAEVQVTGVQLVENWKQIPGQNPDFKVHRDHVKLKFIGDDFETGAVVQSTPYKIGIDDRKYVAEDRDNREADMEGLIVVSSAVNHMYQELVRSQNGGEADLTPHQ